MSSSTIEVVPVSPATGGRKAMLTSIRYVLLFALSVVAVGIVIGFASDDKGYARYRPWISEKLAVLAARPPTPNAIFVGASVTLRSIAPQEIDAAAAAAGCPEVHSINLGMPGARLFELAFMIDKVLETPDLAAGTMVVYDALSPEEMNFEGIAASDRRPVTARLKYLPDLVASDRWSWAHLAKVAAFLRAALAEALGVHAVSDSAVQRWRQGEPFDPARVSNRGYVTLEYEERSKERKAKKRSTFLNKRQERHMKFLTTWNTKDFLEEHQRIPINPFADRIRADGYVPVAYAAPLKTGSLAAAIELAKRDDPGLLAIAITPETAPDVYSSTKLWFDGGHVNEVGAKYVSSIVGRELCLMSKNS
jgi:hypothetical protein